MAVARFAYGRPEANVDTLLYTVIRTSLASIVATNVGGASKISAWVVPSGEDANPENWIHYVNEIPFSNRETFETFKLAVNVGDKIYTSSNTGDVAFFINGIYDLTGRANITVGAAEPESPQIGDIWINPNTDPQDVFYWEGTLWQPTGIQGPANVLSIGTVTASSPGSSAAATITGESPAQTLNLTLPRGEIGPANTLSVGTVSASAPGSTPTVSITGTAPTQTVNFVLPRGDVGPEGPMGPIDLPTQTGNTGKYLTTDGVDPFWETVDALPTQTGNGGKFLTTDGTDPAWSFLSGGSAGAEPPTVGVQDGSIWLDTDGSTLATSVDLIRWNKILSASTTTFSGNSDNGTPLAYVAGNEQVYLNGVQLVRNSDYTADDGSTIILSTTAVAGDVIQVIIISPVEISNAILSTSLNAKGDIIVASANDTAAILSVGTNGQVLKANSSAPNGVEWGTDASGASTGKAIAMAMVFGG